MELQEKNARRKISHAQFFECVLHCLQVVGANFFGGYVEIRLHQPQ